MQRDIKLAKEQHKGDSGKLWNLLKSLGYSKKSSVSIALEENGTKDYDPFHVSRIFNKFYTTVVSNLMSMVPAPSGIFSAGCQQFSKFHSHRLGLRPSFVLSPVSKHFIRKQLCSLNPKKTVGLDEISCLFLRDDADQIIALFP